MGNTLSKGTLFPPVIADEVFSKVKGKSALARLSAAEPIPFNGEDVFTFHLIVRLTLLLRMAQSQMVEQQLLL